ncbi:endonuclease exonuclease phosphatase family protein [Cryptosporidium andersoni]|uniref:Endonuclease exonuclease phosphatase family protein n=1 Tax=Cryptosporidium andersoni TaxID=117008 RepID=A0A1J4MP33_9CRYT|nr:endonuclease exonuclease phosphatase family protein [Cryptosporidium andersoni]
MTFSIVSFNVNGFIPCLVRKGYKENEISNFLDEIYNSEVSWNGVELPRPSIVCIQECKMNSEEDINYCTGCPNRHHAFYSLPTNYKRYSGVATFCRKDEATPREATSGFSWIEKKDKIFKMEVSEIYSDKIKEFNYEKILKEPKNYRKFDYSLSDMDIEGRCIITDHVDFLLVNLYLPLVRKVPADNLENTDNLASLTRASYRLAFNQYLRLMLDVIVTKNKRDVILVGDMNVTLDDIDSYYEYNICKKDQVESYFKESGDLMDISSSYSSFYKQIRTDMKLLLRDFNLIDAYRLFYPGKINKYTCWDQTKCSRINNQGSRIDLFLVSRNLINRVKGCEIIDNVCGSDHCPIVLIMSGNLQNINPNTPPSLCSKYLPSCILKQSLLSNFFIKEKYNDLQGPVLEKDRTSKKLNILDNQDKDVPNCKHGMKCIKKYVSKNGINKNRSFWTCSKPDLLKCNYFEWVKEKRQLCTITTFVKQNQKIN